MLVGLTLALIVVLVLGWDGFGNIWQTRQTVRVYYTLEDGLQGLVRGAAVSLGDEHIGKVVNISDFEDPDRSGRVIGKIVAFSIPVKYQINWDARIELVVPVLGAATTLNIRQAGRSTAYSPDTPMPDEDHSKLPDPIRSQPIPIGVIPGSIASTLTRNLISSALSSVGFEERQREQIHTIIANLDAFTSRLKEMPQTVVNQVSRLADTSTHLIDSSTTMIGHMDDTVLDMQAMIRAVKTRSEKWIGHLDNITQTTDEGLTTINELIDRQVIHLERSLNLIHDMAHNLANKTLPTLNELIQTANTTMANVRQIAGTGRVFVDGQHPVLERMLANLHLSSEQIKLAAIEIRRAPWKLISKPDKTQLETDKLYDSARSFAQAASSVEGAIASIRNLAEVNPEAFEQLQPQLDRLELLESRFKEAEQRFWRDLTKTKLLD